MEEPEYDYKDMSPVQVEQKLRYLHDQLGTSTEELRKARQAELEAQLALTGAKARATLSPACPKVARGGCTVAERNAWVQLAIQNEDQAYETAKVMRQAATDYVKTVRDQLAAVQSIGASVREAYRAIGVQR